ncbi:Fpg/Nei family DNA glycosylase [Streptomyces sodiiphilus]|uniref:DNA-(apurinic or apyrimidinic site) lyase n=1 Tax=Streptomyces sodiiphilus TaxID=226217 RepID=A0ABN2NUA9_9ACTN
MPEGHTIHRLAAGHLEKFGGRPLRARSPQGPFAAGAARIDGLPMTAAEAHGKHLFLGFGSSGPAGRPESWVHIHLGLYGKVTFGTGEAPAPVGKIRLRLETDGAYADLRGPATCALITPAERQAVRARLGPDPLRPDGDPARAFERISRSRTALAALLMDQRVLAGVGNIYRAEILFRHGLDPYRPGRELARGVWGPLWEDLAELMTEGVRTGRIDTVRPEHTPEAMGRPPRVDRHGGEVYVYRCAHRPCLVCGGEVRSADLAARSLYWCPACQKG